MKITTLINYIIVSLFVLISLSVFADETVPAPLKPWESWVMKGSEKLACPFINNTPYEKVEYHVCAWPSPLSIKANNQSARFKQTWKVLSNSLIPLPGNYKHWPSSVTVNKKSLPVINQNGRPKIELDKGNYVIEGQIAWSVIPEVIAVPRQSPFVELEVNEQAVDFPKIIKGELWLHAMESKQQARDTIDMEVVRKVSDGEFIRLETYITLNVSGKMREVELGKLLPDGFEPISINSKLSTYLDGKGVLRTKAKPGHWQIMIDAFALPTLLTWQRPEQSNYWPKEEIWVFKSSEKLRLGKISGAKLVDNNQADMPDHWYELPSYLLGSGQSLSYKIQHRGKPLHLENQLQLRRTMWLAFDNSSYTFSDNINGNMIEGWRLSMKTPFLLESAEDHDGAVLITTLAEDERGVEYRYPGVRFTARGVVNAEQNLPVTGWENHFEKVSLTLNLPPGNRLFAAFGADNVTNSWLGSWTIWTSFIVLFTSIIAMRLSGLLAGGVTLIMMLFIFHEDNAPIIAIINLLIAFAIQKHQPFERLEPIAKSYWFLSAAAAIGATLFFSAVQLREVVYPQLESKPHQIERFGYHEPAAPKPKTSNLDMIQQSIVAEELKASPDVERIVVTGSRLKRAEALTERYQSDALMQAGSGIPNWRWKSSRISWHSPVAKDQTFNLVVLSQTVVRIIKTLGVILILLWLFIMLKESVLQALKKVPPNAVAAILALVCISPTFTFSPVAEANNFPSQQLLDQLKDRLSQGPECAPNCVTVNQAKVSIDNTTLSLTLEVHANADTAISLPRSEFWRPEKTEVNSKTIETLFRFRDWIYIPVNKGVFNVKISGKISPVDAFQLEFKDKPKHVTLLSNQGWEAVGTHQNSLIGNALEFIAVLQSKNEGAEISSRYLSRPFVKVTRIITFDQTWTLSTHVERIAPSVGSLNTQIPALAEENIISADVTVENDLVNVTMPAGVDHFSWQSRLERASEINLTANQNLPLIEHWRIIASPSWHMKLSGLPVVLDSQDKNDYFSYSFYPHKKEQLTIQISRPDAVKGDVLAIDRVKSVTNQGPRTSKFELSFDYRSTRGGEHLISLPEEYQLKEVKADNKLVNLQMENGKLALPILPGKHSINIKMRSNADEKLLLTAPNIDLNAPSSNITSIIQLSGERWVLWTKGPLLGPAVLYWGELLAFVLVALIATRVKFSPLTTANWIILGFGLSLNNWGVLMLMAVWFASVTTSRYRAGDLNRFAYNTSQFLLYALSVVAILSLISIVPASLLSSPNMGIEGNYSSGNHLQWFADKSDGSLPKVSVFSISTLFYKGIMLAWVIWLSFTFISWIKWAWNILGEKGYWKSKFEESVEKT